MKRLLLLTLFMLSVVLSYAVPAYPGAIVVTQGDGTRLTIRVWGDEFYNYTTTSDGYQIVSGGDGFYYYAQPLSKAGMGMRVHEAGRRDGAEQAFLGTQGKGIFGRSNVSPLRQQMAASMMTKGETKGGGFNAAKGIVILVSYADKAFTLPNAQQAVTNLLNQKGYALNGATGCARDYFSDNSMGKYNPQFVVTPVVVLPQKEEYYGYVQATGDIKNPAQMVIDACRGAKALGINFAEYDENSDGKIDNIFIYFAGHSQSEGAGGTAMWPHRSNLSTLNQSIDGKIIADYACAAEYRGAQGTVMTGIGTFCHEFSHVLGLPDLYDTDYEKNGMGNGLGSISLMAGGNYNNDGNTPPYLSALERYIAGWGGIKEVTAGDFTLDAVQTSNMAYKIRSVNDPDEYFIIEARTNTGWDRFIDKGQGNKGMLIYQVDSTSRSVGGFIASLRWMDNTINAYSGHECVRYAPSNGSFGSASNIFYPGSRGVTSFNMTSATPAKDWTGKALPYVLSNIAVVGSQVRFTVKEPEPTSELTGTITSPKGASLANVRISLRAAPVVSKSSAMFRPYYFDTPLTKGETEYVAVTNAQGGYTFNVPYGNYNLVASLLGYTSSMQVVILGKQPSTLNMILNELPDQLIRQRSHATNAASYLNAGASGMMVANTWNAEDIAATGMAGEMVRALTCYTGQSMSAVAEIYIGDDLAFKSPVTTVAGGVTIVSVPEGNVVVAEGQSLRIQFTFGGSGYIVGLDNGPAVGGKGDLVSQDGGQTWTSLSSSTIGINANVVVGYYTYKGSDQLETPKIQARPYQRDATVILYSEDANIEKWQVTVSAKGVAEPILNREMDAAASTFSMGGLAPATTYVVQVKSVFEGKSSDFGSLEFTTAVLTAPYAAIVIPQGDIYTGQSIPLRLNNLPQVPQKVSWSLNGATVAIPSARIVLSGKNILSVNIEWDNGTSETIKRTINVVK